jgi:hypothetical protein
MIDVEEFSLVDCTFVLIDANFTYLISSTQLINCGRTSSYVDQHDSAAIPVYDCHCKLKCNRTVIGGVLPVLVYIEVHIVQVCSKDIILTFVLLDGYISL